MAVDNGLLLPFNRITAGNAAATTNPVLSVIPAGSGGSGNPAVLPTGIITNISRYENCIAVARLAVQPAGTTVTLDVVIQGSVDGTNWFDMAHLDQLVQADPVGTIVTAAFGASQTGQPVAKGSLAVRTIRPGDIPPYLRLSETVAGAAFVSAAQYDLVLWFS